MPQGNAKLSQIITELRSMDNAKVTGILEKELAKAARPFAPALRARILNIPVHGDKHTGLRVRIAACVRPWAMIRGNTVQIGLEMDSSRMPSGEKSLPLMMEGAKRWNHPVYARDGTSRAEQTWVTQAPHEYFYAVAGELGPASRRAIGRALDQITSMISG